jgi:hypothetical protein
MRLLPRLAASTTAICPDFLSPLMRLFLWLFPDDWDDLGPSVRTAAEAAQLLAAVDAALSMVPLAHQAWQQGQDEADREQLPRPEHSCLRLWLSCRYLVLPAYGETGGTPAGSAEEHAAAARAALRLHVTSCRALNWLASKASPEWLASLQLPRIALWEAAVAAFKVTDRVLRTEEAWPAIDDQPKQRFVLDGLLRLKKDNTVWLLQSLLARCSHYGRTLQPD